MALKGDRVVIETDITMTCDTATLRGVVLSHKTSGSGIALGDSANAATLAATASGNVPVGILMNDVVNVDETRYHRNFHKDETMVNARCNILRKGRVTTDAISGTPTVNATAYLTDAGKLTPTNAGAAATPKVGQFRSIKDESGFCTVDLNLPQI